MTADPKTEQIGGIVSLTADGSDEFKQNTRLLPKEKLRELVLSWAEQNHATLAFYILAQSLYLQAPTQSIRDSFGGALDMDGDFIEIQYDLFKSLAKIYVEEQSG